LSTQPEQLKATLDRLRQELAQIDHVDPALRQQLAQSLAEIQAALQEKVAGSAPSPAAAATKRESLIHRLQETAKRFEASHPILSENIGGLIDTLSSSGI
jgi:hypothetical protein